MSNLFLTGNFAPVTREETITTLSVAGRIPDHLDGRYLRIGPNPVVEVDPETYNWFSLYGDGMAHGVRLREGKAQWYRNRWIRTPAVATALGERASRPNHRAGSHLVAANTNVVKHAGRTLALIEAGIANYELGDQLETLDECDFDGTLTGGYTGHPKRDPVTGELHAVSYRSLGPDVAQYSVIGVEGRARKTVEFDVPGKPVLHDIALTENYVLFFDVPLVFDLPAAVSTAVPRWVPRSAQLVLSALLGKVAVPEGVLGRVTSRERMGAPDDFPFKWDPSHPSRIGLLPREGADTTVRWFDIEPCYVFHTLNAYQENGSVICDGIRLQGYRGEAKYMLRDTFDMGKPALHRWVLDLAAGKVRESGIDDQLQEFPGVDPRKLGRRHRYGYTTAGTVNLDPTRDRDAVLRHDMDQGITTTHPLAPYHRAGEFSFVPTGDDGAEDDGLLMGYVYDESTGLSNLTLLDAATLETVATVHLPTRVPYGFHGNWIADM